MRPPRKGRDSEALEAHYVQHGPSLRSTRCPIHITESNKCPLLEHFLKVLELYLYLQKIRRIVLCQMAQRGRAGDLGFTFSGQRKSWRILSQGEGDVTVEGPAGCSSDRGAARARKAEVWPGGARPVQHTGEESKARIPVCARRLSGLSDCAEFQAPVYIQPSGTERNA